MTGPWPPAWWDGALAGEILQRSGEHLLLVGTAIGLALAISLPLGLWISRRPRWAGPVLAVASTVQTVPSLAIFGLLLTVPLLGGIGTTPAIVALTLYALLPLLRGLVTGLAQVPPGLKQAGQALGLSPRRDLIQVPGARHRGRGSHRNHDVRRDPRHCPENPCPVLVAQHADDRTHR
jgi:osmoprotectant transport system permease protein